jgi:hypothetical protein
MASDDPRLRLVPKPVDDELTDDAPRRPSPSTVLAGALAIALVLLVLSWIFTGRYVSSLETELQALRTQAAEQQGVIAAQKGVIDAQNARMDDIRRRVEALNEAVKVPVPAD